MPILCGYHKCTQFHILVDCPAALRQIRYTWRHDFVLNYIKKTVQNHLVSLPAPSKSFINFLRAGEKRRDWLAASDDWELLVDMDHSKIVFPPEILSTSKRPDIVIWSRESKTVVLLKKTSKQQDFIRKLDMNTSI